MKNLTLVSLMLLIVLSSCSTGKKVTELKNENQQLLSEKTRLNEQLSAKDAQIKAVDMKMKKLDTDFNRCSKNLSNMRSVYYNYYEKLTKMKQELKAAFPNNLNEVNFRIIEEDGRLVILLPNKILYKSGSAEFDAKSLEVIQKLSKVFRNNKGLQILVEGHTDEIPLKKGSKYEDNWDLSLARAVKIVRQLETYGVHPERLTASGRGYFAPRNRLATDEARAENRRTEIIIRPKITGVLNALADL